GREEYFSRPVRIDLLQLNDYKRSLKIVRALPGELEKRAGVRARASTPVLFSSKLTHTLTLHYFIEREREHSGFTLLK
ncbi:MAG: hypothetical protein WCE64_00260, partial [Bacteroidales bacterium]